MVQTEVPREVADAGLEAWYQTLSDPDRVRLKRYLVGIDTSSPEAFMIDLMGRSTEDHNYRLSVTAGRFAESMDLDDYGRFRVTEAYIEGLFGAGEYEEAKEACCSNLDLFPAVRERFLADNGGSIPKKVSCRNRLIDLVIGVESQYDMAEEVLSSYVDLGLLDESEKAYRLQSIKIHRMQKTFDNIYNYRPSQ